MTLPIPEDVLKRIAEHDGSLYSDDPAVQAEAASFMGWTRLAHDAEAVLPDIEGIAEQVRSRPLTDVVLLGMGGSSLAAFVMGSLLAEPHSPKLWVLDTTSPVSVSRALAETDPATTIHVLASKSGGTIEPNALYRVFRGRADSTLGREEAGRRFIAITDPGSSLERLADDDGMLACVSTPPAVGGRYSALTAFGLLPAALLGIDVRALVAAALPVEAAYLAGTGDLGLAREMAKAYDRGLDKLNLVAQPRLRPFGVWVEQLVAESLGKQGKGIVPLVEQGAAYVDDHELVIVFTRDAESAEKGSQAADDAPRVSMSMAGPDDLGAWFVSWEYSTAVAGVALGVNPFDQPNVAEAKEATASFLAGAAAPQQPDADTAGIEITAGGSLSGAGRVRQSLPAALTALFDTARAGDYFAVLAYVPNEPETVKPLSDAVAIAASKTGIASCLELGPRYLHSTGQLHKGGPDSGVFLVVTNRDETDVPVPGEEWGLRALHRAQALGDLKTLKAHDRRVTWIDLPDVEEATVKRLADALRAV